MDELKELRVCAGYDFLPTPKESIEDCRKRIHEQNIKEFGEEKWAELQKDADSWFCGFDEWLKERNMSTTQT